MFASGISGMRMHEAMFASGAYNIANASAPGPEADPAVVQNAQGVQLAEETTQLIGAQIGYTASAQVITTADEVSGALIDVLA